MLKLSIEWKKRVSFLKDYSKKCTLVPFPSREFNTSVGMGDILYKEMDKCTIESPEWKAKHNKFDLGSIVAF